jgi:peptide/nickel transport system ATP-binding protein
MYAGRIVEAAPVRPLFATPAHPYTQGLLACMPGRARHGGAARTQRLVAIRGQVSSPLAPPPGCAFEPRCDLAQPRCSQALPDLVHTGSGRQARCVLVPAIDSTAQAA